MPTVDLHELEQLARQRGQPFKVLIVDDEKWVREVFRDFCRLTDAFEIELANTGAEAIEKVKVSKYDLITMDLIMPEMSGIEALTIIKEMSPGVPIMVITGNATEKLVHQAGIQGACRVMYKPVMLEDFVAELTSTLTR
ncbi:MAG: response regulator [Candidatus Zixiibacteriota bacterium]|nr:MAG: response regulator [candidate division Zixibacteria bacterium]